MKTVSIGLFRRDRLALGLFLFGLALIVPLLLTQQPPADDDPISIRHGDSATAKLARNAASLYYDDAFYYLRIAQHVANGSGSTFDGQNPTNGYHPLWLLCLIPLAWLLPDPECLLLASFGLQMLLAAATAALVYRLARHVVGRPAAVVASSVWLRIQCTYWMSWAGMEYGLQALGVVALLLAYLQVARSEPSPTSRQIMALGLVASLVFLARLDNLLLTVCIGLALLLPIGGSTKRRFGLRWRSLWLFAAPIALTALSYAALNQWLFEHPWPISGEVKAAWSAERLAEDPNLARYGWLGAKAIYLVSPLGSLSRSLAVSLLVGAFVGVAFLMLRRDSRLLDLWPLAAFSLAQYIGYALIYHGGFSFQPWYFVAQPLVTALVAALALDRALGWRLRSSAGRRREAIQRRWVASAVMLILLSTALNTARRQARQRSFSHEPLFAGAGWMHQNLPPDATVGAWNAGILSYFSQRQVVNLDGLVNSRSFFLADRQDLCAYLDRVGIDYLVDAFDEEQPFDPYKEQIGLCISDFEPVWDGPGYRSTPRRAMAFRRLEAMIYTLDLRPDFETRVLQGRASIRLPPSSVATGAIELPAPKLQIRSARLNGVDLTFEKVGRGWRMALTPDQVRATAATDQAAAASLRLDLDYLAPAAAGLVFGEEYVHTAFFACHWLPCIGPDLDRASIEIRLDLPVGYRSVASGQPLAQTTPGQHGWRQTQPYPLYTLGFAAGRFKEIADTASGTRLRYLALNDDAAALRAKFADSPRVLEFFEGKAGLPLPHPIYTQVLVPGSVAQEASSFSLIGHRMLDPIIDDPQEDWVIAHEMAHQWWGNLVTCASWDELWLNEGLAVFMTAAWKQHRWGEAAYGRELDLFHQTWSRARAAGFDKPLSWPGQYPSLRMKRSIHYSKAALFLHALREELGESVFWQGLRRYTRDYAGRSVRAADFQAAMEQAAGRSLQSIFETWVYGAEPPKR